MLGVWRFKPNIFFINLNSVFFWGGGGGGWGGCNRKDSANCSKCMANHKQ